MKATDVLSTGYFNEDINAKNAQQFVVEMGLYEVFSEIHEVDKNNRDEALEHRMKCTCCVLVSEGTMRIVEVIKLTECNEIVDSDHRGYLIDLSLEALFEEEFNSKQEIELRSLNLNERTHRKEFDKA